MWLAERRLRRVAADGSVATVRVRIGQPRTHRDDCVCAVELDSGSGPASRHEIHGVDAWQAIVLAMGFARAMLQAQLRQGHRLLWPDDDEPYALDDLFPSAK
ncbi:DUF6968 family protein [Lysobacter enzymogenes]|uniref:DUF6968 domain-containing protein n=1 Tax=Lysobacter enzymogenes TaxID=69 RepID=A0A0S2DM91_LYSEN|nr:hypothetical protein [Lysobacter enzymogenes]ALN59537.1 hypothetical protein GLE_4195 [Lysobacter enzymogenes]QCW27673.1 hypothetical protein FE772_20570 [Lysobacter enzymogenes]QQQ02388.1 hypothetical protein JHW41_05200 [Lysobacter enzymogenes]